MNASRARPRCMFGVDRPDEIVDCGRRGLPVLDDWSCLVLKTGSLDCGDFAVSILFVCLCVCLFVVFASCGVCILFTGGFAVSRRGGARCQTLDCSKKPSVLVGWCKQPIPCLSCLHPVDRRARSRKPKTCFSRSSKRYLSREGQATLRMRRGIALRCRERLLQAAWCCMLRSCTKSKTTPLKLCAYLNLHWSRVSVFVSCERVCLVALFRVTVSW
jgi:hypothetical protein